MSNGNVYESSNHVDHIVNGAKTPMGASVFNLLLTLTSVATLTYCFTRRIPHGKLSDVPLLRWLLLIIYAISGIFIILGAVFAQDVGWNTGMMSCQAGVYLCLFAYLVSKILIYIFMVERVRIVHGTRQCRLKDKLFLFNAFVLLVPFLVVAHFNFTYRISYIDDGGHCHLGMERKSLIPLLFVDVAANIYVTILFILPLTKLQAFNKDQRNNRSAQLRALTIRTIIGCLLTIASTAANAIGLIIVVGQPAWVCMASCDSDVLFCVIVLHFITKGESASGDSSTTGRSESYVMEKGSRKTMVSEITVTRSYGISHQSGDSKDGSVDDVETIIVSPSMSPVHKV